MYVFLNDKYRDRYRDRRYWPCIYLVSDRYQNLQYRTPLVSALAAAASSPLPLKHDTGFECDRLMIGCSALSPASLGVGRFIGQLVLRRRELMVMVIYISLFQVL